MQEKVVEIGIIVQSERVHDYDARLRVFTGDGIQWRTVKGGFRQTSKFLAVVQPLTVAELTVTGQTVIGAHILASPYALTHDLHHFMLANSIADALINLEFVERAPDALRLGITAFADLSGVLKSCYPIFLDFYGGILQLLGYENHATYDPDNLTHTQAKQLVRRLIADFRTHVDYQIKYCDRLLTEWFGLAHHIFKGTEKTIFVARIKTLRLRSDNGFGGNLVQGSDNVRT